MILTIVMSFPKGISICFQKQQSMNGKWMEKCFGGNYLDLQMEINSPFLLLWIHAVMKKFSFCWWEITGIICKKLLWSISMAPQKNQNYMVLDFLIYFGMKIYYFIIITLNNHSFKNKLTFIILPRLGKNELLPIIKHIIMDEERWLGSLNPINI